MPANTGRQMLPLQSMLNPASSAQPVTSYRQFEPLMAAPSTSLPTEALRTTRNASSAAPKAKAHGNPVGMPKSKPQGPVNFAPFEDLDQASYRELRQFQVKPLGQIRQNCEHIPYNSSKKDFFEKTGRESIEAFKYEFRYKDLNYTVMWDYNVGLVRMTPFFKCLGYAKTKPSQMLDKNPGLRDISPSITGGAVSAQGYWMPYTCARAVCATFCAGIAGALIPLFGPTFPSQCTPSDSPYYNEMVIDPQIIRQAMEDVERCRYGQRSRVPKAVEGMNGPVMLGDYPLRSKRESQTSSAFRLPSRPQPARPQPLFAAVHDSGFRQRPMAVLAPSTACKTREAKSLSRAGRSSFASRTVLDRNPFQWQSSFFDVSLRTETSGTEKNRAEKWRPKRRRRLNDEDGTACSPVPLIEAYEARRPQQELERFRAAAALVSLHSEPRDSEPSSAVVVESSEEDVPERRHQKKRPKAHSF
ncbi:hypothetical protein BBK36DRAFT_1108939 [Trichoderma citrinoviride]|uniref:HTH APSES-type domain-containing protein n=1 Tax=Trichoderma citrinoviride TaxID=58853 RepID=A0A2T4BND7_9HYPO|nr:hypothetical protein BBK36DRAFT_1108939 [Trichoderma citrinoviride]PTB70796.1 hypothetical protein BBK36DRAFT_1108939 [Trichoderma citrinoviride]